MQAHLDRPIRLQILVLVVVVTWPRSPVQEAPAPMSARRSLVHLCSHRSKSSLAPAAQRQRLRNPL